MVATTRFANSVGRICPRCFINLNREPSTACAAKPSPRRKQRHGLEQIGLAGAIVAVEQDEARPRRHKRVRVGSEIGQDEAGDVHVRRLSRYCARRSMTS